MIKIFWAGDSTVQTNNALTYPQTGIGQAFSLYIRENYEVCNYARNGRSTKSFIDEGRLDRIKDKIGKGDFLFIQFGHNDEKDQDPSRYTTPFGTFAENLKLMIETAKKKGAFPVLITPLERRCFVDENHLGLGAHSDYVASMKQVAMQNDVPLIDLYSMSRAELKNAGELGSRKWFMYFEENMYKNYLEGKQDNTHLRYDGAVLFAGLIANKLIELGGDYAAMIIDEEYRTDPKELL